MAIHFLIGCCLQEKIPEVYLYKKLFDNMAAFHSIEDMHSGKK